MMLIKKEPPQSDWLKLYTFLGKYPKCWRKGIIQRIILEYADYHCEHCGVSGSFALLHVHHLIWNDKHDCRWQNLLCVCTGCHVRIHNYKWQPGQLWISRWGDVPEWAIARGLLVDGKPKELATSGN